VRQMGSQLGHEVLPSRKVHKKEQIKSFPFTPVPVVIGLI
jgi:hypothetical protein